MNVGVYMSIEYMCVAFRGLNETTEADPLIFNVTNKPNQINQEFLK